MKTRLLNHWLAVAMTGTMLTAVALVSTLTAAAAEPQLQELKEQVARLQREAQDLKADGKTDQANEVMRKAEELRAQAARLRQEARPPGSGQPRPREIKRQIEKAEAELRELRAAGKQDEAAKLERHVQELRSALERFDRPPEARVRQLRGPVPPREMPDAPRGTPEMQRLRHLQAAIENLHAAGMHEPADQLARQGEEMRRAMQVPEARPGDMGPRPGPEMERLRAEVQELRQAVREMRARLEELSRDRR